MNLEDYYRFLKIIGDIFEKYPHFLENIRVYEDTPLMFLCKNNEEDAALDLINTGYGQTSYFNHMGDTALIIACRNNNENIALALIENGNSNPLKNNWHNESALFLSWKNNMLLVYELLKNIEEDTNEDTD